MKILSEIEYQEVIDSCEKARLALLSLKSENDMLKIKLDQEYNRGYVDCAKRFSGESLKPAPNEKN